MGTRLVSFDHNLQRARELVGLGVAIAGITVGSVDASDMLRAAIVQGVAALDAYIHGVVLDLSVDIILGRRIRGSKTQIGLDFGAVGDLLSSGPGTDIELVAIGHVNDRISRETFQRPDDIARALAMVGINQIWSTAFGAGANAAKTELALIVSRRNAIVHSCDTDPSNPGAISDLAGADVTAALSTLRTIVHAIDLLV